MVQITWPSSDRQVQHSPAIAQRSGTINGVEKQLSTASRHDVSAECKVNNVAGRVRDSGDWHERKINNTGEEVNRDKVDAETEGVGE